MHKWSLLFALFLLAPSWAQPHANIGPVKEWISNDLWEMKINQVDIVADLEHYRQLAWRPQAEGLDDHFSEMQRLAFDRGGSLVILDVTLRNASGGALEIGYAMPMWMIRCDDGQEIRNSGTLHTQIPELLSDGLPAQTKVAKGKSLRGKFGFMLPANRSPRLLLYRASSSMEQWVGKSETLVARLVKSDSDGRQALKPQHPEAAWKDNGSWKMRVTDFRQLTDMAGYRALPWSDRLTGDEAEKHFSYVERTLFGRGGSVVLIGLEAKNLQSGKADIGFEIPFWQLEDSQGKTHRIAGVYQQTTTWALVGGFPRRAKLNSGATAAGHLAFH
ncbi:MAG: hypothetical protein KC910_08755, partial [Candidatus Eremiobacteraeota bacterium]|nr:hypothetical protein [Candidatus Eremiobacteraeota bacterium]